MTNTTTTTTKNRGWISERRQWRHCQRLGKSRSSNGTQLHHPSPVVQYDIPLIPVPTIIHDLIILKQLVQLARRKKKIHAAGRKKKDKWRMSMLRVHVSFAKDDAKADMQQRHAESWESWERGDGMSEGTSLLEMGEARFIEAEWRFEKGDGQIEGTVRCCFADYLIC